jgi:hypothetical protein
MRINLEGNLDDIEADMRMLLGNLNELERSAPERKWEIRSGKCKYLGPWASSILFADFLYGVQQRQDPRIKLPKEPREMKAYCSFSGMSMHFQRGPAPDPDHPECETIPLMQFHEARWDLPNGLLKLLRRHR